ncbi:hypothetical protein [Desulfovibrio sp. ZJ369]|uniref:hypothetical protein n=1 Tax=Desulfovibrio sp. ZJ369 TaxID=2709793 RepID=UPI0013ECBC62|nr:hypothetical protein [Desulfovibrio sp. ZJ369]
MAAVEIQAVGIRGADVGHKYLEKGLLGRLQQKQTAFDYAQMLIILAAPRAVKPAALVGAGQTHFMRQPCAQRYAALTLDPRRVLLRSGCTGKKPLPRSREYVQKAADRAGILLLLFWHSRQRLTLAGGHGFALPDLVHFIGKTL